MITWISSYPKSGSTWIRMLLNAYLSGGYLNINNPLWGKSDNAPYFYKAVSPKTYSELTEEEIILLRPAALMHIIEGANQRPMLVKSHHCYGTVGQIHLFPRALTDRAFYLLRDPREIAPSMADHFGFTIDQTIAHMKDKDFSIMESKQNFHLLGSWSDHVQKWLSHKDFPVYTIKYSQLKADPGKVLHGIIKNLNLKPNPKIIEKAIEATELAKLQKQEKEKGFMENPSKKPFFGGKRKQLNDIQRATIERDHAEMMEYI